MGFGENLKTYRKEAGLTQKELAEMCGIATGTIQQYELNKREPKARILEKISTALNVPLETLLLDKYEVIKTDFTKEEFERFEKNLQTLGFYTYNFQLGTDKPISDAEIALGSELINDFFNLNEKGRALASEIVEAFTAVPEYQKNNEDSDE